MAENKPSNRPHKYEKKLIISDKATFEDIIKIAVNPAKQAKKPRKAK